ncbi:DUF1788 domain-containing protein [Parasphingorhabdus flavimaris]|uniref:DUF1788 domain-containing protein n=1 Tax=Parasphingorhabdus flavimaris TaxID=266812 RepID=A0ABX2N6U2_9SPHN|nr:DUF1788 domain-containing protein [Parasphingorhabdus flavimaris]NVD29422.1 DUF1788 domain-containing protein [Parasphingorhabdus flavimaris]
MKRETTAMTLRERQDHLLEVIASPRFLKKQGLGNEVPFFICPFLADDAVGIEQMRSKLVRQLANRGVSVLDINLYDLSVQILRKREIWDDLIAAEEGTTKDELKELLQSVLDPETNLIPEIGNRLQSETFDVLFLSGVGEVFPYIRSHNVLNNLQSTAKEKPTLLFFPGSYTHSLASGASLDLFGILRDDKYYRAFNIFNYQV